MKPIAHFVKRGDEMLERWAQELNECESASNVIERIDAIRETGDSGGGWPPSGARMFSPLAAEADTILREFAQLDPRRAEYLVAYAHKCSISVMARDMGVNRSTAERELLQARSAWAIAVYFRSNDAREYVKQMRQRVASYTPSACTS